MLILHPSSYCDVCLEPYTSDSSPQTPHAIPCGHVFCAVCLETVNPANCPLCRKPFSSERIKKLHVDRPDSLDEIKETEFLQRLILAWDASEEELLALLTQIGEWLDTKDEDENTALRKAVSVLAKFQKLKTRRVDDHRVIKRLKDQIESEDHQRALENEEFKAIEASLMAQVEGLQTQLSVTQEEVLRLRTGASARLGTSELADLRNKVTQYETELEDLRPLLSRVKRYEYELRKLRQELDYYAYPSSTMRDNPLPQPPALVSYENLPTLAQAISSSSRYSTSTSSPYPTRTGDQGLAAAYTNGYTSGVSPSSEHIPKKNKGKEREPGPSYNLHSSSSSSDSTTTPATANSNSTSFTSPTSEEVLPGASPRRRVIPTAKSKPSHIPTSTHKMDPKLVSGARPDLPAPPTPEQALAILEPLPQRSRGGVDPARDFVDPYTLTAAYVTEYGAGYSAGYQLAEYTPGQAAAVGPGQRQGQGQERNGQRNVPAVEDAVAYVNGYTHAGGERRERREREAEVHAPRGSGLESMNALGIALPDTSVTPVARSSQLSRDGNSQVFNYDAGSTTTGDSASLALSTSSRGDDFNAYPSRRAPRDSASQASLSSAAQSQKTQTTGYLTDTATLSSFSTGLSVTTGGSTLTRDRSLRQQPLSRNGDTSQSQPQSALGLGLPSDLTNGTGNTANGTSSRRTNTRHMSLPVQPTTTVVASATTTTTAPAPQPQPMSAPNAHAGAAEDNHSVRTALTASSWGTINTHSVPLLGWQTTGSSLTDLPLRNFAPGAGMPLSTQSTGSEVDMVTALQRLENQRPSMSEGTVVHNTGNGANVARTGGASASANGDGVFPVRESDEERTPMSRSTRTLASVSSGGANNGSSARLLEMLGMQVSSQAPSGHGNHDREGDRERDRERDRDRTRSRERRRQTHPASLVPAHAGEGTRHTQMMTISEHSNLQPSTHQYASNAGATYSSAQQMSQLWFENPAAPATSYVQPHTSQPSSHPQSQSQSQSQVQAQTQPQRRSRRRSSVSTGPAPIDTQHTGSHLQSAVPNTAPAHAPAPWSDAGYYTDGPSSFAHRSTHNTQNAHGTSNAQGNVLTSPTLFNSNSTTNALGLDGLNDPRPLQITAPTPIVSSRGFLRSFSYDNFS